MMDMVAEADEIFALIGEGDMTEAGRHMATMDRDYAGLTTAIGALSLQIQAINSSQLDRELARASALQRWEYLFGGIVFLIITMVAIYGHRMGMVMDRKDRQLREARDEAERANKQKSEFLANMSHEIRTPLNGILGMATILENGKLPADERKSLRIIRESGDHLLATINDILDLSKIEAGQLEIETTQFKPHDQVSRLERLYTLRAREQGIEFSCEFLDGFDPLTDRLGDPTRISQILHNLISNAIKFTEQGEVRLSIGLTDTPDEIRLAVTDTGCGLTEEQKAKIFDPFVQAEVSTTRRYGGTGLGLAIVNQLVEKMQGSLSIQSSPGNGSTFEVRLPLPAAATESAAPDTLNRPATIQGSREIHVPAGLKILIVDDNLTNRLVASGLLSGIEASISFAEDGLAAVMAARTTAFDLILMDINMPNMDGFEALRLIRMREEEGLAPRTTIFALTASVMSEQVDEYRRAGFDGLLAKPLQQHVLLSSLQKSVEGLPDTYWQDLDIELAAQGNG